MPPNDSMELFPSETRPADPDPGPDPSGDGQGAETSAALRQLIEGVRDL